MTSITWVIGSSVYTKLSRKYHPAVINMNRAMVALPFFAFTALIYRADIQAAFTAQGFQLTDRIFWLSSSIISSYAIGDILFIWSAFSIGFPAAQAIGGLFPLWAAFSSITFLGESPSFLEIVGMMMAISGTLIIVLVGKNQKGSLLSEVPDNLSFLKSYKVGILLAFATSLFWAYNSFATYRGGIGLPPAAVNIIRMSTALVTCSLIVLFQKGREAKFFLERQDYRQYLPIFIFEAFGGGFLYIYGMTHSSITVGSTLTSLSPVFAVPIAVFLGWEKFSLLKTLAILVVVLGGVLMVV